MDIVIWLLVVVALVAGLCGYSEHKWWIGRGPGSFDWWKESRRRNGWWW